MALNRVITSMADGSPAVAGVLPAAVAKAGARITVYATGPASNNYGHGLVWIDAGSGMKEPKASGRGSEGLS